MNKPMLSVVVPNFNTGEYIEDTLRSILSQSRDDVEIIVIDGGSTDCSVDIIRRYESRLAYWCSEKDGGQAEAINKGLIRASGEWVAYLNSDDLYLPGCFEAVKSAAKQPKADLIVGPCLFFGKGMQTALMPSRPSPNLEDWIIGNRVCQPSVFWRRTLIETVGVFDQKYHYCMDYEYWLRLLFSKRRFQYTSVPLSAFRLHEKSKTVSQAEKFAKEEQAIRATYRPRLVGEAYAKLSEYEANEAYSRRRELLMDVARSQGLREIAIAIYNTFTACPYNIVDRRSLELLRDVLRARKG